MAGPESVRPPARMDQVAVFAFADGLLTVLEIFFLLIYVFVLVTVIGDLFQDDSLPDCS